MDRRSFCGLLATGAVLGTSGCSIFPRESEPQFHISNANGYQLNPKVATFVVQIEKLEPEGRVHLRGELNPTTNSSGTHRWVNEQVYVIRKEMVNVDLAIVFNFGNEAVDLSMYSGRVKIIREGAEDSPWESVMMTNETS